MEETNELTDIRTDLWGTMDVNRLQGQRELILTKLSILTQSAQTPTILQIYNALQQALLTINDLIDANITAITAITPRSSSTSHSTTI
jgi:hypothetical protein